MARGLKSPWPEYIGRGLFMFRMTKMNGFKNSLSIFASIVVLALAAQTLLAQERAPALADIKVSFKLDPRLTQGLYMGERWVSPATYTGTTGQDTVEARILGMNAQGKPVSVSPRWIPSDPEMVTVSPGQGGQVTITVKRAGESRLQVTSAGVSKELLVKATQRDKIMQVEIAQSDAVRSPSAHEPAAAREPAAAPTSNAPKLSGEKQKLSYALGMSLGSSLRKASLDADLSLLTQGIKDGLSAGPTLLTEQEMLATLAAMQNEQKKTKTASQAARKTEVAEKNKQAGEAFLAANKAKEGVVNLPSGLQYRVLKAGDGDKPAASDTVVAHYRGSFVDGTEFANTYLRKQPATVQLRKAIQGWREALPLMPVGSKWELVVPSDLAYGSRGDGRGGKPRSVGPNTTLIFEVELISIQDKPTGAQAAANVRDAGPQVSAKQTEIRNGHGPQ
jgi:FKBP-type peptidyl-prolyl cis-trans isomerase FklB